MGKKDPLSKANGRIKFVWAIGPFKTFHFAGLGEVWSRFLLRERKRRIKDSELENYLS